MPLNFVLGAGSSVMQSTELYSFLFICIYFYVPHCTFITFQCTESDAKLIFSLLLWLSVFRMKIMVSEKTWTWAIYLIHFLRKGFWKGGGDRGGRVRMKCQIPDSLHVSSDFHYWRMKILISCPMVILKDFSLF